MKKQIRFISAVVAAATVFCSLFGMLNAKPLRGYAAEGGVDSYSALSAANDNFVYLATEFYEYSADGSLSLTDYSVDPGQMLQMRVYIKTDRYMGTGKIGFNFDNTFFDVNNGADDYFASVEHLVPLADGSIGLNSSNSSLDNAGTIFTKTSKLASSMPVFENNLITIPDRNVVFHEGQADESVQAVRFSETSTEFFTYVIDGTKGANVWECTSDEWCFATDITVREGLSDGTTGWTLLDERFYSVYDLFEPHDKGTRPFDIKSDAEPGGRAAMAKGLVYRQGSEYFTNVSPENFITDDCNHVFVIGNGGVIPDNTDPAIPPETKPEIPTEPEIPSEPEQPTEPDIDNETQTDAEQDELAFAIKTPSVSEIKYGDSIYLRTEIQGTAPFGAYVQWYCSNPCFSLSSDRGDYVIANPQSSGSTTFTAVFLTADGDVLASDTVNLTAKANIFYKIIGFFKQLFGLTTVYDQII